MFLVSFKLNTNPQLTTNDDASCTEFWSAVFLLIIQIYNIYQFWPCHGSGKWSPAYHCEGPVSIPGQSIWDLWWTRGICQVFSPSTSVFLDQRHSTNASYSYFIHPPPTLFNLSIRQCSWKKYCSFSHSNFSYLLGKIYRLTHTR
jgi:hypothetical protein